MANNPEKRQQLVEWFSAGKKPLAEHFLAWLNSFFHKTEDGITVENGNLGVGIDAPLTKLHVNGGMKIGEEKNDTSKIPQGTLQWTGQKLQIWFDGKWADVWTANTTTFTTEQIKVRILSKQLAANTSADAARLSAKMAINLIPPPPPPPAPALRPVHLNRLDLSVNFTQTTNNRLRTNKQRLNILLFSPDDRQIWPAINTELVFEDATNTDKTLQLDVNIPLIESWTSIKIQLQIIFLDGEANKNTGELSVEAKEVTLSCLYKK